MNELHAVIDAAQRRFANLLTRTLGGGALTPAQYARFLTMQHHLTKGVQRYFYAAAAHRSLTRRKPLRAFLVAFANEEELHYEVAGRDLAAMGLEPGPCPLDVELWHALFERHTPARPFARIGAAAVLENLSGGVAQSAVSAALAAPFLTPDNTRFVVLHRHQTQPHGDQVVQAIHAATPDAGEYAELLWGARAATVIYLRMAHWAIDAEADSREADLDPHPIIPVAAVAGVRRDGMQPSPASGRRQ